MFLEKDFAKLIAKAQKRIAYLCALAFAGSIGGKAANRRAYSEYWDESQIPDLPKYLHNLPGAQKAFDEEYPAKDRYVELAYKAAMDLRRKYGNRAIGVYYNANYVPGYGETYILYFNFLNGKQCSFHIMGDSIFNGAKLRPHAFNGVRASGYTAYSIANTGKDSIKPSLVKKLARKEPRKRGSKNRRAWRNYAPTEKDATCKLNSFRM